MIPGNSASICSKHFTPDDYERRFLLAPEIYQKLLSLDEDAIDGAFKELVDMTPTPMSDMFEKQSRDEALKKHEHRKELATKEIPPTAPGQLTLIGYCKITILITMF